MLNIGIQFFGGRGGGGSGGARGGRAGGGGGSSSKGDGELVREYKDGTKLYKKDGAKMPAEEQAAYVRMMDNIVLNRFCDQMGINRSDVELNTATQTITVWNKRGKGFVEGTSEAKSFYKVDSVSATKSTYVKPNGSKDFQFDYVDAKIKFKYAGGKT